MLITRNTEFEALLRRCADTNYETAMSAQAEYAQAIEQTIRKGVLVGDIVRYFYDQAVIQDEYMEFSLDMLQPGEEDEYNAYTIPGTGLIPQRHIEGDYVRIPCYEIGNAIDWDVRFAKRGDSFQIGRINEIFQAGFTKKINDDGFQTIITAAADRNILIYDANAAAGQFTKRLISLAKVAMKRNAGGNSASPKRGELTDVCISPEAEEDIRAWGLDQVDEVTRREIYVAADSSGVLNRVYGVNLHTLDEFGEGQVYQSFYTNGLGATMASADVEVAIGLDLKNRDSLLMPMKEEVQVFNDLTKHRERRIGIYGWASYGFACLDSRRVIVMSF